MIIYTNALTNSLKLIDIVILGFIDDETISVMSTFCFYSKQSLIFISFH